MFPCVAIILALKKSVAFPDDLIRRIDGHHLLEYTINSANAWLGNENVWVVTDSDEIELLCKRLKVSVLCHHELSLNESSSFLNLRWKARILLRNYCNWMILWPYTPNISEQLLREAFAYHLDHNSQLTVSVKKKQIRKTSSFINNKFNLLIGKESTISQEVRGFVIAKPSTLFRIKDPTPVISFELPQHIHEIQSFEDWWVCEGLLKRKRLLFRVIGNSEIGMGHIYRALTLAHEICEHDVVFLCSEEDQIAVQKIAGKEYTIYSVPKHNILNRILELKPHLVINDCLNTEVKEIALLKQAGILTMNFEDLGSGALGADVVINELYEKPLIEGEHIKWGSEYMFLREEFYMTTANEFVEPIKKILITMGGSDLRNLTEKVLNVILPIIPLKTVELNVVVGEGYTKSENLKSRLEKYSKHIKFTNTTGVMTQFMENCQLAICGNGRTVYEMAHMNIPAVVISHHEREATHSFAIKSNGFIHLGVWDDNKMPRLLKTSFLKLMDDHKERYNLWESTVQHNFIKNKKVVTKIIKNLLEYS